MSTPRIYVACLAAYTSGFLHGRWINANQSPDDLARDVRALLNQSPVRDADEWAIHDYDGFGALRLSEWESLERLSAIAAGMARHGEAFSAWLSYDESHDPTYVESFEDAYRGEWDSLHDYAENYAQDLGMYDAAERTGFSRITVDLEGLTRDLDIDLQTVASDHHTVYVFEPHV
jgi:antirestriction protein